MDVQSNFHAYGSSSHIKLILIKCDKVNSLEGCIKVNLCFSIFYYYFFNRGNQARLDGHRRAVYPNSHPG